MTAPMTVPMLVPGLTQELVRHMFDYREEGYLVWKVCPRLGRVGRRAGRVDPKTGYCNVKVSGKTYGLHRLIFVWHHGYNPENCVDHIDRNTSNNRVENLREITSQCNSRNCRVSRVSESGITGVVRHREGKWLAHITINKKMFYLGTFKTIVEAARARHAKEVELNWNGCSSTSSAYLYLKELGEI